MIALASELARFILAAVLAASAVAKARDREAFRATLSALPWVPAGSVGAAALAVPAVELLAAVVLVVSPAVGALAAVALLVAFSFVAELVHRRGAHVPCSCFGDFGEHRLGRRTVARNAGLAALALGVLAQPPALDPDSFPVALTAVALTATAALVAAARPQIGLARDQLVAAGAARARRAEGEDRAP